MGHAKCRTRLPVDAEPVLTFEPQHLYIRANVGVPLINGLWRALFCQKEQMFSEAGTPADGFFRYGPDR